MCDVYADPDDDDITVDGTIKLCEDLGVDPEDVVLLAVAFELKSPAMGRWTRAGWIEGWRAVGCVLLCLPFTSSSFGVPRHRPAVYEAGRIGGGS